ncbi:MAG: hydrogenase maturation protease [Verrucomicrobia bacterium]|nr:MAG: hydrogenase maturation protease [Verrucomicrobiota bacterium]
MQTETSDKILLLGLGNDILTDDAVGLLIARQLRGEFAGDPRIVIHETQEMGLALLDFITGYREVVLVDAVQTCAASPGTLHELDADGLKNLTGRTPHFLGVGETLALGRKLGLAVPEHVRIFAIEVADAHTLGTNLSPVVQNALPAILERIRATLRGLSR